MGMAASQARYLALTARKSNTEWEGQQINQARTALSNQSAGLFNRLLSMDVPQAPDTTNYTKLQYSYSDGDNESVIDSWQQINTADPNYNYVVSHYYTADIFKGIKRLLEDPQVQIKDVTKKLEYDSSSTSITKNEDGSINVNYKINDFGYDQTYNKITSEQAASDPELASALTSYEKSAGILRPDGTATYDGVYGYKDDSNIWHFFRANEYSKINAASVDYTDEAKNLRQALTQYETENNLLDSNSDLTYDGIYSRQNEDNSYSFINTKGYTKMTAEQIEAEGSDALRDALTDFETTNGLLNADGSLNFDNIYAIQDANGNWTFISTGGYTEVNEADTNASVNEDLKTALTRYEAENKLFNEDGSLSFDHVYGYQDSDGTWHFTVNKQTEDDSFMLSRDYTDYSTVNGPAYVGNSKLTELDKLVVDKERGIDQVADLAQILKDFPDSELKNYLILDDDGNLQYDGKGIYTFDLLGKTYYTTDADLRNSAAATLAGNNTIDSQTRLAYYNAAYVPTRIEETNQALLETGKDGRFTSVKFDNDSIVYDLNVEEVTDQTAYDSAMNDYLYKKAQYEKTIADINAKTSLIQKEDRTLELRLKQLDTEQNALATEMDAVKKVIKDNVEKTFKTFSE